VGNYYFAAKVLKDHMRLVSYKGDIDYVLSKKIISSRSLLIAITAITALLLTGVLSANAFAQEVTVYKSPLCGCCGKWVEHINEAGFDVKTRDVDNLNQIRAEHGVPSKLASCHTATVGDYAVEGHVHADAIKRLLAESPDVKGIAVPGMPMGAPGMAPTGSATMHTSHDMSYDVLTFDTLGNTTVYESR
jgi:hypothetical protein